MPSSEMAVRLRQNTMCEVCGDIGYKKLLLCCRDCKCSAVHQYCLDKVVYDASLVEWLCHECLQRQDEKVSSERPPSHDHFVSTVHQPITKRVESSKDAGPWRNKKRKSYMTESSHGDSSSNVIDGLTQGREKVRFQLDYRANNELQQRSIATNVPPRSTLQRDDVDKVMPLSPNDGCKDVYSCGGIKNIPCVREKKVHHVDICSSSRHDTTESSDSSERFDESQSSSCHWKIVKVATASLSHEDSGEEISSESVYLESDDHQAPPGPDYVLSSGSCLSEAEEERVVAFIQETKPEITAFVAVMGKSNVQPPGPFLGISKEYAYAHFPDESTDVTLERPGESKKWYPRFYKRDKSRKYMLTGKWLDFILDNHVQEGDICLLLPTKDGRRSVFTVYLLRTTSTHSRGGARLQRIGQCLAGSSAKTSEIHIEESTNGEHICVESRMDEITHKSLDSEDGADPSQPPYVVACRNDLSKAQKKIVEERVRAIQSKVPIYVAVMKNNNAGNAQRWMLELGARYASVHLPAEARTVVLQCRNKRWETQMVIHNGRRWFLNGGWTKFARDNGLRVGDFCLFELKKNESKITMAVHLIYRERFERL
ncbi:hypothetical protein ACP4OV_008985 [Aristida adscensionis]